MDFMGTFLSALVFPLLVPRVVLRMPVSQTGSSRVPRSLTSNTQVLALALGACVPVVGRPGGFRREVDDQHDHVLPRPQKETKKKQVFVVILEKY